MDPMAETLLADRLLDAGVEYLLAELSGDRLAEVLARDANDLLDAVDDTPLQEVVQREAVQQTALVLVDRIGGSAVIEPLVTGIADAVYELSANDEHQLGEVIDRAQVQALVRKVLSMPTLRDELLRRMADSPVVAQVASWFVTRLVSDVMQQNRELAERVPGVSSLLSLGDKAVGKVRGARSRHLDQFLGDLAGRGTQVALRRLTSAVQHTLHEAPIEDAAMEIWDLHAEDPVSGLKGYLSQQELRELVGVIADIVLLVRQTDYFRALLRAGIDVFFDDYGSRPLGAVLAEAGLSRDDVLAEVQRYGPPVVRALKADGRLESLIRTRLRPFFHSERVRGILAGC
ncbi:MAG: hypothetical protein ACRDQB_15065 [Thermocrispum sp.]